MPKSQHTLKFKQMYGEQDAVDKVKARIKKREDQQDRKDKRDITMAKIKVLRKGLTQTSKDSK